MDVTSANGIDTFRTLTTDSQKHHESPDCQIRGCVDALSETTM